MMFVVRAVGGMLSFVDRWLFFFISFFNIIFFSEKKKYIISSMHRLDFSSVVSILSSIVSSVPASLYH